VGAIKISYLSLFFYLLLIALPILLLLHLRIRLVKSVLIAVLRMVVQLGFVALYLETIFRWNLPWVNFLYILIMIAVANQAILRQSGLRFGVFFLSTLPAYLAAVLFSFLTFFIVLDVETFVSARYIIPIGGMILGNILRGNIISLDRLTHALVKRKDEYIYYLSLGASRREALKPFMAESMKAAIAPYIATVSTMGLVSLPGMMTGQILGGASPAVAIQYQIMIMVAIFVTSSLSIYLSMWFSMRVAFDDCDRLRPSIFLPDGSGR